MPDRSRGLSTPGAASSADYDAPPALGDLREAVHQAAGELRHLRNEMHRLRVENEHLRERISQLEEDPSAGRNGTALLLEEEDPAALRQRIDRFIEAIDAQLNEDRS